jgi:lambda family phage portal protein
VLNPLDRVISWLSPTHAARRVNARLYLRGVEKLDARGYYDGADIGRRGGSIRRSLASADTISARKGATLRGGSLDLIRNNPHARRGCEAIVSNVFGEGIIPRFRRKKERAKDLDELARGTLDTTNTDYCEQLDLYGIQALMGTTSVQGGESLVHRVWDRTAGDVPVRFQVLEADHLDSSRDTGRTKTGGRIIQGVEFDSNGRRSKYWMFEEHPGGSWIRSTTSVAIDARDVAHVYRIERPGQVRGIPWLAPIMLRVADFSDYEEAQLLRQKIAACFVGVKTDPISVGPASATANQTDDLENIEPGSWYRASNGSTISFGTPPPITDYKDYASVSLHAFAAGLGVSYEALTGDMTGVNFASGRMARQEFERNVRRWRAHTFVPQGCDVLIRWWLEAAALAGADTTGVTVRHIAPAVEMISPREEVPATRDAVRSGQKTLAQVAAERGMDIDELLDEIEETNEMLDERRIVLDSDPRKVSAAGLTQARAGQGPLQIPPTGDPDDMVEPPPDDGGPQR